MSFEQTSTVEATIHGRVQGVYYRGWTAETAARLGLAGWVRNNPDGSVSALFHGPVAAVEQMLAACRDGPLDSRVTRIETEAVDLPVVPAGFRILR